MDVFKIIVVLYLFITVSAAAKLLGECINSDECPAKSSCLHRGCDGLKCVCQDNFMPSDDESRCVQIAEIGEQCDMDTRCRGQNSRCGESGRCVCDPDHIRVVLSMNITYCKLKHFLETQPLFLGQNCRSENSFCSDVLGKTMCQNGVCQCKTGYRKASIQEINTFPYQLLQCVPIGFSLNKSVPETLCPFKSETKQSTTSHRTSSLKVKPSMFTSGTPLQTTHTEVSSSEAGAGGGGKTITFTRSSVHMTNDGKITPSQSSIHFLHTTDTLSERTNYIKTAAYTHDVLPTSIYQIEVDTTSSMLSTLSLLEYTSSTPTNGIFISGQSSISTDVIKEPTPSLGVMSSDIVKDSVKPSLNIQSVVAPSTDSLKIQNTKTSLPQSEVKLVTSSMMLNRPSSSTTQASTSAKYETMYATVTETALSSITATTADIGVKSVTTQYAQITSTSALEPTPSKITMETTITTSSSLLTVLDGEMCNTNNVCMTGGICEADKCGTARCRSEKGYAYDRVKSIYRKLQRLGESCEDDEVCIGPFTKCSGGICRCNKDYILSSDGLWCTHKTSWFINFPLIGDGCSTFFSECFHSLEQSCEDGKCQCMTGLRKVEDDDLLVPSSTYYQCRNASLGIGQREPRDCEDGAEAFPSDPYYNTAIKRIRKMQGIIFGVLAGVVAVICFIIAGICYYRHRNRTMVQDMTSDKGSVISFDRQSSGKYSFKIPRPFMPIIKNWDTDQMSYGNSAFTADDSDVPTGDQTLRSSRSIPFPEQSDTDGYSRPIDRQMSVSTASTVEVELTSSLGEIEVKNDNDSPISTAKSYQANNIKLEFGEG